MQVGVTCHPLAFSRPNGLTQKFEISPPPPVVGLDPQFGVISPVAYERLAPGSGLPRLQQEVGAEPGGKLVRPEPGTKHRQRISSVVSAAKGAFGGGNRVVGVGPQLRFVRRLRHSRARFCARGCHPHQRPFLKFSLPECFVARQRLAELRLANVNGLHLRVKAALAASVG